MMDVIQLIQNRPQVISCQVYSKRAILRGGSIRKAEMRKSKKEAAATREKILKTASHEFRKNANLQPALLI